MEITQDVLFLLFMDSNKWSKVKANAERNGVSEKQALANSTKDVTIENYDSSMVTTWADTICNWMDAN
jgi:hypothetical protein